MANAQPTSTSTAVRDPNTGNFQTVRGVGALKGRLTLEKGVDLTKPIASQVMKGGRSRKNATQKRLRHLGEEDSVRSRVDDSAKGCAVGTVEE